MQPKGKKDVIYNYDEIDDIVIDTTALDGVELPEFDAELGTITYDGAKANFNGFNDTKDDVVVTLNKKNTLTIKNGAGKAINFLDENGNLLGTFGHILPDGLTYDKKRTGIEVADAEVAGLDGDLDIDLSNEENLYYASAVNVDMSGLQVNASISGNAKNNILKAGEMYTTIRDGATINFTARRRRAPTLIFTTSRARMSFTITTPRTITFTSTARRRLILMRWRP